MNLSRSKHWPGQAGRILVVVVTGLVAAAAGYLAYTMLDSREVAREVAQVSPETASPARQLVGQRRPDYTLGASDGSFVSATDFDGKVVLVNFWATWCAPCREEMPMLMDLRERHHEQGFEVVGIALDDVGRAREFAAELGINYPILVGSTDVMAMLQLYGNASGTLPYSVLVDRAGIIRWTRLGVLEAHTLVPEIEALIAGS